MRFDDLINAWACATSNEAEDDMPAPMGTSLYNRPSNPSSS